MRRALAITVLVLATAAAPAAASTKPVNPTKAQVAKAIKSAEASKSLWATVNICSSKRFPYSLGIRGQMPALGFAAWLSLNIQLNYWSAQDKKFVADTAATRVVRMGRYSTGLQQGGARFKFYPKAGKFNASVQFFWRREGKLLGSKTLTTTAGHPGADFGSPAHYSAASCTIP